MLSSTPNEEMSSNANNEKTPNSILKIEPKAIILLIPKDNIKTESTVTPDTEVERNEEGDSTPDASCIIRSAKQKRKCTKIQFPFKGRNS